MKHYTSRASLELEIPRDLYPLPWHWILWMLYRMMKQTTIALSPSAGLQQLANAAAAPAPKAKAKAKTVAKPKAVPKSEASPKAATKSQPKPKGVPKAKGLKRPASASGSAGSAMKRPASKQKDPDHVSAGKCMYKKNGVWCIKLSGKEVVRVFWLHLVHVQSAYKHI